MTREEGDTRLAPSQPEDIDFQPVVAALQNLGLTVRGTSANPHLAVGLTNPDAITRDLIEAALRMLAKERARLDETELTLIDAAIEQGANITSVAELWKVSRQAAQQRYRKLGGTRELSAGRPKPTGHTVTRYWVARAVEELDSSTRGEITVHPLAERRGFSAVVTGGDFIEQEPVAEGSVVFLGDLPEPGQTAEGVVCVWQRAQDPASQTRVVVRAENVPLTATPVG
jgi:hypothetical protein